MISFIKTALIILFLVIGREAHAAVIDFENTLKVFRVGDIVPVSIFVIPSEADVISIANLELVYDREKLWAKSFTLAPGWLAVPGNDYDFIDNTNGRLQKTAGYIGRAASRTLFGAVDFVAIGSGSADIKVGENSFIFDPNNRNVLSGETSSIFDIGDLTGSQIPNQLFDIRLELENPSLFSAKELIVRVVFENFGQVKTPVDMIFVITDRNGRIVATSKDSIIIETQAVYAKKFIDLDLSPGDYAVHLNTRYGADIIDDFSAEFEIVLKSGMEWFMSVALLAIGVAAAVYIVYRRKGRKQKYMP